MKIAICGSMKLAREMYEIGNFLKKKGHQIFLPEVVIKFVQGKVDWVPGTLTRQEGAKIKKEHDLIRKHFQKIKESDAILVVNKDVKGIKNYIGANTFLEMGFAYAMNKKIYLLNDLPDSDYLEEEIKAMEPIILNGDLEKIK